jgi:ABC-type ATPase with predicted acetyltransferase domain
MFMFVIDGNGLGPLSVKTEIKFIIDKRVPTNMTKPKHTHPWMNTDIRRKINQKHSSIEKFSALLV